MEVKILRSAYSHGVTYQGYCLRCQRNVSGTGTGRWNTSWETKGSAVRNAKAHLVMHERADTGLANRLATYEIVDTVTIGDSR